MANAILQPQRSSGGAAIMAPQFAGPVVTVIPATIGAALAQGSRANISMTRIITPIAGAALAQGSRANISMTRIISASPGVAVAQGLPGEVKALVLPPVAVYPDPSLVAAGVKYGPTGQEFTGTFVGQAGSSFTVDEVVNAIWSSPYAMTVAKYQAMK